MYRVEGCFFLPFSHCCLKLNLATRLSVCAQGYWLCMGVYEVDWYDRRSRFSSQQLEDWRQLSGLPRNPSLSTAASDPLAHLLYVHFCIQVKTGRYSAAPPLQLLTISFTIVSVNQHFLYLPESVCCSHTFWKTISNFFHTAHAIVSN